MEEKLIQLIKETNTYYDLNIQDVTGWIVDNKEKLLILLLEENGGN